MVTRVRIEAEGTSPEDVQAQLEAAHESFVRRMSPETMDLVFGEEEGRPGLADAQAGEMLIERFAKNVPGSPPEMREPGAGHGAIFWVGRMTAHYAKPQKRLELRDRQPSDPYVSQAGLR